MLQENTRFSLVESIYSVSLLAKKHCKLCKKKINHKKSKQGNTNILS